MEPTISSQENKSKMEEESKHDVCSTCSTMLTTTESYIRVLHLNKTKAFCSNMCKARYINSNNIVVCTNCHATIERLQNAMTCQSNDEMFCSCKCMSQRHNSTNNEQLCSVCGNNEITMNVFFDGNRHQLCSDKCLTKFKKSNKLELNKCKQCKHKLEQTCSEQLIQHDGLIKEFCSSKCLDLFKMKNAKKCLCSSCRTSKNIFSMIENVGEDTKLTYFCSLSCFAKFKIKHDKNNQVLCQFCNHRNNIKYHIVMSDASIKGFCSMKCAEKYFDEFDLDNGHETNHVIDGDALGENPFDVTHNLTNASPSNQPSSEYVCISETSPYLTHSAAFVEEISTPGNRKKLVKISRRMPSGSLCFPQEIRVDTTNHVKQYFVDHSPKSVETQTIKETKGDVEVKTAAVMCKPTTSDVDVQFGESPTFVEFSTQTEGDWRPTLTPIPLPLPIYIPCPARVFPHYIPQPIALPVPIPIPVFLPSTLPNVDSILESINEIKQTEPTKKRLIPSIESNLSRKNGNGVVTTLNNAPENNSNKSLANAERGLVPMPCSDSDEPATKRSKMDPEVD